MSASRSQLESQSASDRLHLPLLTPTAQRLLSAADESVRQNIAFLELVAVKDPVAVSKLLAIANSAYVSQPRQVQRIRDAIMVLGTDLSYQVLLQSALLSAMFSKDNSVSPALPPYLRSYMLSMTMTMRQLRKSVALSFKPLIETTATFSALGVVAGVFGQNPQEEAVARLTENAAAGDYRLHDPVVLRDWVRQTSVVLRHWKFDEAALLDVEEMSSELFASYDGHVPGDQLSPEAALVACAQWLLSTDFNSPDSDKLWSELPAARRCGFHQTNIAPNSLRLLMK